MVHDAVRPFVTVEQITRVIEEARRCKAAILGYPRHGHGEGSKARQPAGRCCADHRHGSARTHRAGADAASLRDALLKEAFAQAEGDGVNASDEAGLVERIGHDVHVVQGSERNIKITKPADMDLARFYLQCRAKKGMSYSLRHWL